MELKLYYAKECNGVTIAVFPVKDSLDVYYKKPDFPLMFAFGLPRAATLVREAFKVAEANIENYMDMFD